METPEEACCTIDYLRHKEIYEERRARFAAAPETAVTVHQAQMRLIADHHKEARVPGGYTITCDEPVERSGAGTGPAPLQFLVASVGF
jgi:hypothetical protein